MFDILVQFAKYQKEMLTQLQGDARVQQGTGCYSSTIQQTHNIFDDSSRERGGNIG